MIFVPDFLQTGDVILFKGSSWLSYIIEFFGRSPFSHVGMIVRNPRRIGIDLDDGVYLLESGWNVLPDAENHRQKYGVQLHLLTDVIDACPSGSVFVRAIECARNDKFYHQLRELHAKIHDRPYDIRLMDWLEAEYNLEVPFAPSARFRTTDRFWCASLVAYLFDQLGLIEPVNWSLVAPREFTTAGSLKFTCMIDQERELRK